MPRSSGGNARTTSLCDGPFWPRKTTSGRLARFVDADGGAEHVRPRIRSGSRRLKRQHRFDAGVIGIENLAMCSAAATRQTKAEKMW